MTHEDIFEHTREMHDVLGISFNHHGDGFFDLQPSVLMMNQLSFTSYCRR